MKAGPEKSLEFFVNYACNAKCPFCFNPPDPGPELEKGLPFEELARRMYEGYAKGYRAVKFIGGEVTIRDDLPKMLGLARRIGYGSIQITTNGLRLADPRYARRLVALGADAFRFSIHGHTSALHDALVGVPGALDKVRAAIDALRPLGVRLGVNTVLSRPNVESFPEMLEFFNLELGIDDVLVYFLRYQGFASLAENRERLKLRMAEAAPHVLRAFERSLAHGRPLPALIHFPPCALPELRDSMLDWSRSSSDDVTTLPDGEGGPVRELTNRGKRQVGACSGCSLSDRCLGVEQDYVAEFGDSEFRPVEAALAS